MNLNDAEALAELLMEKHISCAQVWKFVWVNVRSFHGRTCYDRRNLELSIPYVLSETEAVVEDTIKHEIAHINVGVGHGHDRIWKAEARRLGANPRSSKFSNVRSMPAKYKFECVHCKTPTYFARKIKRTYACVECCTKFNRGNFSLRYELKQVCA